MELENRLKICNWIIRNLGKKKKESNSKILLILIDVIKDDLKNSQDFIRDLFFARSLPSVRFCFERKGTPCITRIYEYNVCSTSDSCSLPS